MITEHSAGAIVFREENGKIFYLILHYEEGHWGYPKGHIENRETIEETAGREIREETGLTNLEFLDGFKEQTHYFYHNKKGRVFKTVTFLLTRTSRRISSCLSSIPAMNGFLLRRRWKKSPSKTRSSFCKKPGVSFPRKGCEQGR
jgi:8-oxo-dGTP pyrophosphatase MutT (NUDIX family)